MNSRTQIDRDQGRRMQKETDENLEKKQRQNKKKNHNPYRHKSAHTERSHRTEQCSQSNIPLFGLTSTMENIRIHLLILRTGRIYPAQSFNKYQKYF